MPWARIDNGTVVELSERDPTGLYHPSMIWVEFDASLGVDIDWTYDGATFTPPIPEPIPPPTIVSALDFINRFTGAEKTQIAQACIINSDVFLWWSGILAQTQIDLLDPLTETDIQILVQGGLLTEERKEEILTPSF